MRTQVVRGKRLRATQVDRCGLPQAGDGASIVTKGFVTVRFANVWKDAEDLEQTNADGENCVSDRTPPELKWTTVEVVFCDVDVELFHFFTGNTMILDYDDNPVGFWQDKQVNTEFGAALELWSGTGGADCEEPTDDSVLEGTAAIRKYGYWVAPAVIEATLGDIELGASVATFTLTGRAVSAPMWGKGPYDVVAQDGDNTPGRLLTPIGKNRPWGMLTTSVEPPAVTDGVAALELPSPYYGEAAGGYATAGSSGDKSPY